MDVATLAASAIAMQQAMLATNVQMAMLKSSIEMESKGVLQLLEGAAPAASNPPHLGNLVDTTA